VHLLPAERADHRIIDSERVCQAIEALGDTGSARTRAAHFAVLADPTRLALLTCISAAGPISVSDLVAATGLNDTTVSQALRHLRTAQIVSTERDGRIIRYQLADHPVSVILASQQAILSRPQP
jgi:DNA-binding transcriptional ArsR family regulator